MKSTNLRTTNPFGEVEHIVGQWCSRREPRNPPGISGGITPTISQNRRKRPASPPGIEALLGSRAPVST
jgi:hypothetical protein